MYLLDRSLDLLPTAGRLVIFRSDQIEHEVDRYIGWPGQALAYKIGDNEIRSLRAEAKAKLGACFDIRQFHDKILGNGAVPLSVLRQQIEAWADDPINHRCGLHP